MTLRIKLQQILPFEFELPYLVVQSTFAYQALAGRIPPHLSLEIAIILVSVDDGLGCGAQSGQFCSAFDRLVDPLNV